MGNECNNTIENVVSGIKSFLALATLDDYIHSI